MAGENDSYLRIRAPEKLLKRLRAVCRQRSMTVSQLIRNLIEGACVSADAGDPLTAPLLVATRRKQTAKE